MPTDRDLFDEEQTMVAMSFGDHIEELRARLILGLAGLMVGVLITFVPPLNLGKRVMVKIKHQRTADCVVAGYRVHTAVPGAIGSLLLGLYPDEGALMPVGVVGAFPMVRRRELFVELQPLIADISDHPWAWASEEAAGRMRRGEGSRWNPSKDLSFVPLRPERVVEVGYDYMEGIRFRHPARFVRWRPDRDPTSCGYAQLAHPARFDLATVLAGRVT